MFINSFQHPSIDIILLHLERINSEFSSFCVNFNTFNHMHFICGILANHDYHYNKNTSEM